MSTREYFEGLYRSARMHGYPPSVLATSFEFINDYPMPRIHGRLRQPLSETQRRLISPGPIGSISLSSEPTREEDRKPQVTLAGVLKTIEEGRKKNKKILQNHGYSEEYINEMFDTFRKYAILAAKGVKIFKE